MTVDCVQLCIESLIQSYLNDVKTIFKFSNHLITKLIRIYCKELRHQHSVPLLLYQSLLL